MKIQDINARQILDSRGNPTVEAEVTVEAGTAKAAVPSGASTGVHEAHELRDERSEYDGKSVHEAVENVNEIKKELVGMDVTQQKKIDQTMIDLDGTENKERLGANAILAVSLATARAHALSKQKPLYEVIGEISENDETYPVPFANIINGGEHAGNDLAFQEFMIAPTGAETFSEGVRAVAETYQALKNVITEEYGKGSVNVGDEGGFAPPLSTAEEALELITEALKQAGHKTKTDIAMDAAASEFYDEENETYQTGVTTSLPSSQLIEMYTDLVEKFDIVSIEDPFHEDHYEPWRRLQKEVPRNVQIVGDDLTVSNERRITMSLDQELCNALLLKVNQIGTLTEAIESANLAFENEWNVMVSHRSGETEDTFISDLAIGLGSGQIKLGAPARGERTAKYNRILRIEDVLGEETYGY